jgi:hypothetical protein
VVIDTNRETRTVRGREGRHVSTRYNILSEHAALGIKQRKRDGLERFHISK